MRAYLRYIHGLLPAVILGGLSQTPFPIMLRKDACDICMGFTTVFNWTGFFINVIIWFAIYSSGYALVARHYKQNKRATIILTIIFSIILFVGVVYYRETWGVDFW